MAKTEKQITERMAVVASELTRVEAELQTVESQLEGDFRRDYLRLVAARGEDAMRSWRGTVAAAAIKL